MATDPLTLQLTTLTPFWTGGADKKSDRFHVTGIMGSLRWWYEVFVRSVGGNSCDLKEPKCLYDDKKSNKGLCDVCRIFGATGWSRRFKIIVSETGLQQRRPQGSIVREHGLEFSLSRDHPSSRNPRWYLPSNPLYGQITLAITPTAPLDKDGHYLDPNIIGSLLQFVSDRASLGAKPQMGMGVIHLANRQSLSPLINHLKEIEDRNKPKKNIDERLPCLQNMFFARVLTSSTNVSATFDLKYDLRAMFRDPKRDDPRYTDNLRHTIMGYVAQGRESMRIGAKIMMSYPYENGTIRMWGWLPIMDQPTLQEDILDDIHDLLKKKYGEDNILSWLYYASQEDRNVINYLEQYFLIGAE
jgi:CRISPR-associated protein Cmr1